MWNIYFIDENPSELLKLAFAAINGLDDANVSWCKPDKVIREHKIYNRSCSYVFSFFDGHAFNHLKNINMKIFGPQLLLDYLRCNESLPKLNIPLFSTALKGIAICFTGFDDENREKLGEKISMMHGTVIKDLTVEVNILISSSVGTKKLRVAADRGIPVVLESWVNELWTLSANCDPINGLNEQLIDKCRVPVFYKLKICLSGLNLSERAEAKEVIEKNGGEWYSDLTVGKCTHLVAKEAHGKKYNYAEKWQIHTVSWKWLSDSIEKGFALDENDYKLDRQKVISGSTPNSQKQMSFDSRSNEVSVITVGHISGTILYGNDDDNDDNDVDVGMDQVHQRIWDNCVISFLGCELELVDKWCGIIDNNGGKTCRTPSEAIVGSLTHVVVGHLAPHYDKQDGVVYVNRDWLECCLDSEKIVEEEGFIVEPQIHANIIPDIATLQPDPTWDSMGQYFTSDFPNTVQPAKHDPSNSHTMLDTHDITTQKGVFVHCVFHLLDSLSADQSRLATSLITDNAGSISTDVDAATHQVTPEIITNPLISSTTHLVTIFYLESCVQQQHLVCLDLDFLYRPVVSTLHNNTFNGVVLSFSGYHVGERKLMKTITHELGAVVQEQMARRPIANKNILATTHLIIGKMDNKKYPSSKVWKIPAVTKHWLGACLAQGRLVETDGYQLCDEANMSIMTTCDPNNLNETHLSLAAHDPHPTKISPAPRQQYKLPPINNKHLQIRNNKQLDMSLGDLDSPILRPAPRQLHLDMDFMKTPEHFPPVKTINRDSFDSPDMTRALKSRLALLDLENKNNPNKYLDISLSDMVSKPACRPLHSVVMYISRSLLSEQMALKDIIEKLGGTFCWVYDAKSVTHVICSLTEANNEPISDRNRDELSTAMRDGKILVSDDWLRDCNVENCRLDEALYIVDVRSESRENSSSRSSSNNSRKRKGDSSVRDSPKPNETRPGMKPRLSDERKNDGSVAWMYENKSSVGDVTRLEESMVDPADAPRVVMLSGVAKDKYDQLAACVEQLGGVLDSGKEFDRRITHLVCSEPGKNAKYLSALAAGKWILHPSYLEESARAGKWLDETVFEWGGPKISEFTAGKSLSGHDMSLCNAARRMREMGGGAFREWRVCIIDKPEKAEKLSAVISAGDGTVLPWNPLPPKTDVTHLLVNKTECVGLPDLSSYRCYKVEFLSYYLMASNDADTKKFIKKFEIRPKEMASLVGTKLSR